MQDERRMQGGISDLALHPFVLHACRDARGD
jgi:hypothetical protein